VLIECDVRFKKFIIITGKLDIWRYIFCRIIHMPLSIEVKVKNRDENTIHE
jgi:hypothetical protein